MEYAVARLKEAIIEIAEFICDEDTKIKRMQKEMVALNEALELCESAFNKIKHQRFNPSYSKVFHHLKSTGKAIVGLQIPEPEAKKGKTRIPYQLCFSILRAITYCKKYNVDSEWFKSFLKENGELELHLKAKYGSTMGLKLPYIANDERWFYKLEDVVQHNLFSFTEEKIIKKSNSWYELNKRIFFEDVELVNEALFNKSKSHNGL